MPQMVMTNTSGGVTGGDRFRAEISVEDRGAVAVTTQAAERAYRAQPGQVGRVSTVLSIGPDSRLHWLPQETILFDGCNFERRLRVDVASGGRALIVEPVVFGRSAMGEQLSAAGFRDRIELCCDGETVFRDSTCLEGNVATALDRPGVGGGSRAMALVLFADPAAEVRLDDVREILPACGGATLLRPDVLVARLLGDDAFVLRQSLQPLIELLHGDVLPRPWMI